MSAQSRATSCAAHVRYAKGCPACRDIKAAYEANRSRLIAYGRWDGNVDGTGARRRIEALAWNGWPLTWLSARLGGDSTCARKILVRGAGLSASMNRAVRALFDELWDAGPPAVTTWDRRAVAMARKHARARGFMPVGAWDDGDPSSPHFIDSPDAVPAPDCLREDKRRYGVLIEETVELTSLREHPEMIAVRLGVKPETVERTLQRAGCAPWRAAA